jgi:hypothetical protein
MRCLLILNFYQIPTMKKFLALATAAGLSAISTTAASAQSVNFPGTVTSYCEIATSGGLTDGSLTENATPATQLYTKPGDEAKVKVLCNDATGQLTIAKNTSTVIPTQPNVPVVQISFRNGGSGNFATVAPSASTTLSTGPLSANIPVPTAAAGDTAWVQAQVDATGGALLLTGNTYQVVVDATVTP